MPPTGAPGGHHRAGIPGGPSRTVDTLALAMERSKHLAELERQGTALADAAEAAGLDAPTPTTPAWTVRDLLRHTGDVHRWAATYVAEGRGERIDDIEAVAGALPEDADLLPWYRDGSQALVHTLTEADPAVDCWSFLPAPSPLAFWTRRQAHETAIHRADAESAGGVSPAYDPGFAADGVDELLFGFFGRGSTAPGAADEGVRTIQLLATDLTGGAEGLAGAEWGAPDGPAGAWLVRVGPDAFACSRGRDAADVTIAGPASDLYLLVWNRRSEEGLEVDGDTSLLEDWRANAQITWGRPRPGTPA
jgi:uncharacterized protein (TIGR03083 family)